MRLHLDQVLTRADSPFPAGLAALHLVILWFELGRKYARDGGDMPRRKSSYPIEYTGQ